MKNLKVLAITAITAGLLFSCQNEDVSTIEDTTTNDQQIETEVLQALQKLYFNPKVIKKDKMVTFEGTTLEGYLLEDDIFMTKEQIFEMLENDQKPLEDVQLGAKQYRTRNLVRQNATIVVMGYTGGQVRAEGGSRTANGLTANMQTGFQRAIDNYNNVGNGFNLRFEGFLSSNTADAARADIIVYNTPASGAGGSAGFPSGGNPFRYVRINSPMANLNGNVNEFVIAHEIGHCIGFRHTDYFSRQSCGQNVNEGDGGIGAIRIPGTPAGFDATSYMVSCFSTQTDGEFNENDKIALREMY